MSNMSRRRTNGENKSTPDVRELAVLVIAEIAKMASAATARAFYSTRKGDGPDWLPAKEWKRIAPSLAGAFRPTATARWLLVPRESVEAYRASLSGTAAPVLALVTAADEPWSPTTALASVGLRRTGAR